MKRNISEQARFWIVINYISLALIIMSYYIGKHFNWPLITILIELVFILLFIISFTRAFIKTKLWNLVHSPEKKLDEREIQIVLNSLRISYSIFTIFCLIIMYGFALMASEPVDVLIAGTLLYMAHTLPAAVVGWNEKNTILDT
jgi:hypothetical protein